MSKWLNQFLENEIVNRSDKSDRFEKGANLSDLSGCPQGLLDKKVEKIENNPRKGGDKSDRFKFEPNMSPLSLRSPGLLDENFSPYDEYDFDERLSIAEYDGEQMPLHTQRIVYLDAFISVLTSLPATNSQKEWLDMKIQTALAWIEAQEYRTIN